VRVENLSPVIRKSQEQTPSLNPGVLDGLSCDERDPLEHLFLSLENQTTGLIRIRRRESNERLQFNLSIFQRRFQEYSSRIVFG